MPHTCVELHFLQRKETYCVKSQEKTLRPTEIGTDQIIEKLMIFTNSHSLYRDEDKVSRQCRLSLFKISFQAGSTYQMRTQI